MCKFCVTIRHVLRYWRKLEGVVIDFSLATLFVNVLVNDQNTEVQIPCWARVWRCLQGRMHIHPKQLHPQPKRVHQNDIFIPCASVQLCKKKNHPPGFFFSLCFCFVSLLWLAPLRARFPPQKKFFGPFVFLFSILEGASRNQTWSQFWGCPCFSVQPRRPHRATTLNGQTRFKVGVLGFWVQG